MKPKYVYFLKPKNMDGPIKIGCSDTPKNRLLTFAAWSPFPLELLGFVPGGYADESYLHQCFANSHSHGEWFHSTPALRDALEKMIGAGSIDAVRQALQPVGTIHGKHKRRPRTENEKRRFSYERRVSFCQQRVRKNHEAWRAPSDVMRIIHSWSGYRYWSEEKKIFIQVEPTIPSQTELARLDEYLADPVPHSIVSDYQPRKKTSICIPVFPLDEEIAA